MKAVFIHDHRFPIEDKCVYESYGFDNNFYKRYLDIFSDFKIIARSIQKKGEDSNIIGYEVSHLLFEGFSQMIIGKGLKDTREFLKDVDLAIVRLPSVMGLYLLPYLRKINMPYIIEVVGCIKDAMNTRAGKSSLIAPILYARMKHEIKSASHVVYVTERFLQKRYTTNGESISCSNVILRKEFLKQEIPILNIGNKIILGTCATLNMKYKGQHLVMEQIKKLQKEGYDIEYQLVGGGNATFLNEKAKELGIENQIKIIGRLNHDEVFHWLDKIDVYIQPSLTEGLPRSVIEALSRGKICIGSMAGGIPELISEELLYENIEELSCIIKNLKNLDLEAISRRNILTASYYSEDIINLRRKNFFQKFINEKVI